MKIKKLLLFSIIPLLFLASCDSASSSDTTDNTDTTENVVVDDDDDELIGINELNLDYDSYKEAYGSFKMTIDGEEVTSTTGTYIINVTSKKQDVVVSGYLEGQIVIQNGNDLSSFKGVNLYLNNTFIVSDYGAAINYMLDDKNVSIITNENTVNYVVNKNEENYEGHGISSDNNLELTVSANSDLNILTAHGHTIKADGNVKLVGDGNITLSSGHDGIHCHNFTTYNSTNFGGVFTISNAISQGIEASVKDGTGVLNITNGTFVINNSESLFKVDATINITNGSVTSEGIWSDAIQKALANELTVTISDQATVKYNGEVLESMTL